MKLLIFDTIHTCSNDVPRMIQAPSHIVISVPDHQFFSAKKIIDDVITQKLKKLVQIHKPYSRKNPLFQ